MGLHDLESVLDHRVCPIVAEIHQTDPAMPDRFICLHKRPQQCSFTTRRVGRWVSLEPTKMAEAADKGLSNCVVSWTDPMFNECRPFHGLMACQCSSLISSPERSLLRDDFSKGRTKVFAEQKYFSEMSEAINSFDEVSSLGALRWWTNNLTNCLLSTGLSAQRTHKLFALLRDDSTDEILMASIEHQQSRHRRTADDSHPEQDSGHLVGPAWMRIDSAVTRRCERERVARS
jgi:hypothetical protein